MSREKLHVDPGDEARMRKLGPQPPTAGTPLSTEKEVLVDEVHETVTSVDVNDEGVPRVRVTPLRVPDGCGRPMSNVPTVGDYVRRHAVEHEELMAKAAAQVVPAVEYTKPKAACWRFLVKDSRGVYAGTVCWCEKDCPALVDGACAEGALRVVQVFVRRAQPATMAEYEKMMCEEGAGRATDTAARIQAKAGEIVAKAEEERKVAEAERLQRDEQIRELRRQERAKLKFEFATPENFDAVRKAAYDAARMR